MNREIYLPDIVGRGYADFWRFKGDYRVVKGSRASKKSKTTALWFIYHLMKYSQSNLLVIRKEFNTLRSSCFTELKWAINRLGVAHLWDYRLSPLEMVYRPTGQRIIFRGLDDPQKITSITVETGVLNFGWIEEAFQIERESDFDMLDESLRGNLPPGLFYQWTLTFNPWHAFSWIKTRFFNVNEGETVTKELKNGFIKEQVDEKTNQALQTLTLTTNYLANEFIDQKTLAKYNLMKVRNPRRYQVAGLGEWGVIEGIIYENWKQEAFEIDEVKRIAKPAFGLDFGYTNDPTALFCGLIDAKSQKLWVFDEIYEYGMSNERIFEKISQKGYEKEKIIADSAEPKSIDRLYTLGLRNIRKARKGNSVTSGIDFLQDYEIIIHPRCANFLKEINNYTWDENKDGRKVNRPIDDYNHLMDAMRYAVEPFMRVIFSFE